MGTPQLNPRESRIRRQLERAEQKTFRKTGRHLEVAALQNLRIQTANPLQRAILIFAGAVFVGVIVWLWTTKESPNWTLALALIGLVPVIIGIRGRKKEVHKVFEALGDAAVEKILDGLF